MFVFYSVKYTCVAGDLFRRKVTSVKVGIVYHLMSELQMHKSFLQHDAKLALQALYML